ncbi:hypothetical protein Gpo141_00004846 [Globisporangium polare]
MQREDVDFGVLEWLYEHLPVQTYPLLERDMRLHTQIGSLNVVQWLHEHVDQAADEGHWDVVKLIAENQSARRKATSQHAINYAARNGQLDVVKYLVESETTLW